MVTAAGDDARLFAWVNSAWRDIQLMHESWLWRRGAALGQVSSMGTVHNLAAPGFALSDFASWKPESREYKPSAWRVSDGQQVEVGLKFLPWDEFRTRFVAGVHSSGGLQFWTVAPDGEMWVAPTPDSAHMVRADYIKDVQELLLDADVPQMPSRFHSLIMWKALIEYGGYDAASEVFQRADRNYAMGMPALLQSQLPMRWISARPLA